MELLKVANITKVYNTGKGMRQFKALNGVSFDVHEGEFVAIMGPSGSGKTTLLNILATLDKPTCGEVLLDGHSFNRVKDSESARFRREHLGFVFQDFNLLDSFNLKDNILLPLVLSRMDVNEMERILLEGDVPSPVNPAPGCRFAGRCAQCMERCTAEQPELREIEPGHFVACHLCDR